MPRDVLVIGGGLAGCAAALSARRSGAQVHLVMQGAEAPSRAQAIPTDIQERATACAERIPVPVPEAPDVFALRARRLRRWLDELGVAHDGDWPAGMHTALLQRCEREGVGIDHDRTAIELVHGPGGVCGAVLVEAGKVEAAYAHSTMLATGDVASLFEDAAEPSPPSGLALGTRIGLVPDGLEQLAFWDGKPGRGCGGFHVDGRGLTRVRGLVAVGPAAASPWKSDPTVSYLEDVVRGLEAGVLETPAPTRIEAELMDPIDEPLAPGFMDPKLDRLRHIWTTAAGPERVRADVEVAERAIVQLRGEAMDYARARAQGEVHRFYQATDAAVLGIRALQASPAGLHTIDA